jgi:hypothetical protein
MGSVGCAPSARPVSLEEMTMSEKEIRKVKKRVAEELDAAEEHLFKAMDIARELPEDIFPTHLCKMKRLYDEDDWGAWMEWLIPEEEDFADEVPLLPEDDPQRYR